MIRLSVSYGMAMFACGAAVAREEIGVPVRCAAALVAVVAFSLSMFVNTTGVNQTRGKEWNRLQK